MHCFIGRITPFKSVLLRACRRNCAEKWIQRGKWVKQSAGMWVSNRVKGEGEWEKELRGREGEDGAKVQPCAGVYTCTQNRCFPPHLQAPWLGTATLALLRQRLAYPPSVQLRLWVKWWLISQQKATGWRLMEATPFSQPPTLRYTHRSVYTVHTETS